MKKIFYLFISLFFLTSNYLYSQITTVQSGNWNDGSTWDGGVVPTIDDDVEILNGHTVTVNTSGDEAYSLTIDDGGTLSVTTGGSLEVTADIFIDVGGELTMDGGSINNTDRTSFAIDGTLTMTGGTISTESDVDISGTLSVSGSGTTFNIATGNYRSYMEIADGSFTFSGGTITLGGYFTQSGGTVNLSGSSVFNLCNASNNRKNKYGLNVYAGTFNSSGNVEINILHASRYKKTVLFKPNTSSFTGGSILIQNGDGLSSKGFYCDITHDIYKLKIDVNYAGGTGNTFSFLQESSDFTIDSLTVVSGDVYIKTGEKIKINKSKIGSNNFVIESKASVIFTNAPTTDGSTLASIKQKRPLTQDAWHYISSSLNDTRSFSTILGSIMDASGDYFYRFDEDYNNGTWRVIYPNNNGFWSNSFTAARGYAIYFDDAATESDSTITFYGTVRASGVSYSMTRTGDGVSNGFNIVGNPYTSSILANNSSNSFLGQNSSSLDTVYSGIYLWDQSIGDYKTVSSSSATDTYLAPSQGFMVRALSDGSSVSFNTNMQRLHSETFYKDANDWIGTTFKIEGNGYKNITDINFNENMTNGMDISCDVAKVKGNANIALYSLLVDGSDPDVPFAIQALPLFTDYPVSVNLAFDVANAGDYTISLDNFTCNFDSTLIDKSYIELEDTYTNQITDLRNNSYTFNTQQGTFTDRFIIHFNRDITSVDNNIIQDENIYTVFSKKDKSIVIKNSGKTNRNNVQINIYNILGKVLYSNKVNLSKGGIFIVSNLNENNGLFVVKVSDGNSTFTKKIILNR